MAGDSPLSPILNAVAAALPSQIMQVSVSLQSSTLLSITWDTPSDSGGLPILQYWVMTDNADFVYNAPLGNGLSLTYSLTVAQPGNEG